MLRPEVVDRIAAGEVVERPASVVKELLENALDAGANSVSVHVEKGGQHSIEVADDGRGMDAHDACLALEQHATSKIRRVGDLDAIETLGFRGEALASIASVSRMELTTRLGDGEGIRVLVEGSGDLRSEPAVRSRGTSVRVNDLFFNTPARRKHLRRPSTELSHVARVVQSVALMRPSLRVRLTHDSRELIDASPVETLEERIHQILGADVGRAWIPVESFSGRISVHGGTTEPDYTRPNRRGIHLFVNARGVQDGRLTHAVTSAYGSLLATRRYPATVLFLELPAVDVDVNVHPRKVEVRFVEPGRSYAAIRSAVATGLATHMPLRRIEARPAASVDVPFPQGSRFSPPAHSTLPLQDWKMTYGARVHDTRVMPAGPVCESEASTVENETGITATRGPIQPLAQYANTYILAADEDGLLIIDQHVAHERILYEQFLDGLSGSRLEVQQLLVPEVVELEPTQSALVEEHIALLAQFGLELEPFGGNTWRLRSAPALLGARRLSETVRVLIASIEEGRGVEAIEEARHRMAASMACHGAVRAREPLTREVMLRLLTDLSACKAPARCPHGRPVLLRVGHDELERRFGRR